MADELVDIVDPNNNIVGTTMKSKAHVKGLLHRTVIAEVKNSAGKWLFVQQAPDRQDPGQLVSPVGGHVRAGEIEEDALKREALEELGLKDFKFKFVGRFIFNRLVNGKHENHFFIIYEIFSDTQPTLNEESVDFVWMSEEEIITTIAKDPKRFGTAFYAVVEKLYPFLKKA